MPHGCIPNWPRLLAATHFESSKFDSVQPFSLLVRRLPHFVSPKQKRIAANEFNFEISNHARRFGLLAIVGPHQAKDIRAGFEAVSDVGVSN